MYNYLDLGLVNTEDMFEKAYKNKYAVPAFNFISIEQFNAIFDAVIEKRSPLILLVSPNLHKQLGFELIARLVQSGVDRLRNIGLNLPVALHLDHGMNFEQFVMVIEYGFSSVMIDGSMLPFEENIALTKKVVDYAHSRGVTVEGELGSIAGTEEGVENNQTDTQYTDPALAEEFVKRTKVDSLAISIGTVHGLVKIKPKPDGTLPDLRYDILEEIEKRMPGFPIVLHGASSIPSEYVEMINKYGGKIEAARGIPEDQIARVSRMAVCKINIASDGWICAMANTRKILAENPSAIDSRVFTLKIRPILADLYKKKIELLGSENRI